TVRVDDDTPVAVNDGNLATVAETTSNFDLGAASTILGNDSFGADGQASSGALTIGAGNLGGTVTINGSNHLIYTNTTHNADSTPDVETFTYTIKDGDGDTTTATFTVTLTDTGVSDVVASNVAADEDNIS